MRKGLSEKLRLYRMSVLLAAGLAFFSPVFSSSKSGVWIIHIIQKGENLTLIGRKYNVEVDQIIRWNTISRPDRIYVGQKLKIWRNPGKTEEFHGKFPFYSVPPAQKLNIIYGYRPYGENRSYGITVQIIGDSYVKSIAGGKVVKIGYLRGYGEYILIDHGKGWHTMYSHLDEPNVRMGQNVEAGERIAKVKNQKLFFLMAFNGKPVNPVIYLNIES